MDDVFSYLSWLENDQASLINDFVDSNKYNYVTAADIDYFLDTNHIDYGELPQYLKDKIDELDI